MMSITVDIADLKVCGNPNEILITHALGSCIAVILYDPLVKVGGMIHYMLPMSKTNPEKAKSNPAMFADTGIPLLFQKMYEKGCTKENLIAKVAGGAKLYDDNGVFDIGKRNYSVLRKLFWKNKIMIAAEDVGGSTSRTVRLQVGDGKTTISSQGQETVL